MDKKTHPFGNVFKIENRDSPMIYLQKHIHLSNPIVKHPFRLRQNTLCVSVVSQILDNAPVPSYDPDKLSSASSTVS